MVKIPPPEQLSSVPEIDSGAKAWAGLLADGLGKIRISELAYGNATVTWPGGQPFSTALQVTHGLTKQALLMLVQCSFQGGLTAIPAFAAAPGATAQQMQVQAWTIDAQNPANGSTAQFYWLAAI